MSSGRKCLQPLDLQLHGQRQCLPKQVNLHFHFGQIFFKLGQIHLSNYAKYMLTTRPVANTQVAILYLRLQFGQISCQTMTNTC